jgi:pimeloyl-ACP methyl ester carboxylesterase
MVRAIHASRVARDELYFRSLPSVSTPPYLALPPGARRVSLDTTRGELAGLRMRARGDAAGTVLLVPGWTGSKEDFIALLEPLSARGWDVVSYDQRGQYESPGPDDEAAYTLGALARDLLDVAEPLSPVHVVGHSFGGLVGREAALACEGHGLASLTLLCSGPGPLPQRHHDGLGALHAALPHVPLDVVWEVKEAADREGGWVPPSHDVASFMRTRFLANSPYGLRAKTGILMDTPDRTQELAALAREGFPVGVVYGPDDDAWTIAEQDAVADAVGTTPRAVLGAGHSPAAERPEETATILDTLLRGFAAAAIG